MDGFAVRSADVANGAAASRVTLRVIADIPAGSATKVWLTEGEAARIMTGAPMPQGADAVVPVEDTDFDYRRAGTATPNEVQISKSVKVGDFVRLRGADVHAGQVVLRAGCELKAQDIGMLAMLGVARVQIYRRPRVALLSSGDELLAVDAPLESGKIRDSNSYMLAALITRHRGRGCESRNCSGPARGCQSSVGKGCAGEGGFDPLVCRGERGRVRSS